MQKRYVLTSGPIQIPPDVYLKITEPVIHHGNHVFETVVMEVCENLRDCLKDL